MSPFSRFDMQSRRETGPSLTRLPFMRCSRTSWARTARRCARCSASFRKASSRPVPGLASPARCGTSTCAMWMACPAGLPPPLGWPPGRLTPTARRSSLSSDWSRWQRRGCEGTQAETLLAGIPAGVVPAAAYRGIITNNRGAALLWTGNLVAAEQDLTAGLKEASAAQLDLPHMNALGHLALIAVGRGKLRLAYEHGRAAADVAERRGWTAETQVATAYLALALCHFEWGNLDQAYVYLDQATGAHRADQEPPVAVALQIARTRFHLAAGEATAARTALAAARARYGDRPLPAFLHRLVAVEDADLDLATGHPQRVQDRFTQLDARDADVWSTDRERVRLALAQLALGQPQQAAATVGPLLADEPGNPGPVLEAWLVTALAADRLREDARALDALSAALHLAAPENRQRPFLTADPRLCELLARHAELVSSQHDFIKQILTNLTHQQASRVRPTPLGEPLTDRETAVLRYLPTLLTNTELAEQMYISVNTVKVHLKSLYRKLDVASRRQAVHRARELGLL